MEVLHTFRFPYVCRLYLEHMNLVKFLKESFYFVSFQIAPYVPSLCGLPDIVQAKKSRGTPTRFIAKDNIIIVLIAIALKEFVYLNN